MDSEAPEDNTAKEELILCRSFNAHNIRAYQSANDRILAIIEFLRLVDDSLPKVVRSSCEIKKPEHHTEYNQKVEIAKTLAVESAYKQLRKIFSKDPQPPIMFSLNGESQ